MEVLKRDRRRTAGRPDQLQAAAETLSKRHGFFSIGG